MANEWGDETAAANEWGDPTVAEAPPRVGKLAAFGRGITQGATFNFGDEIEGVIQAALRKWVENDPESAAKSFSQLYRSERNYRRDRNKEAEDDQKGWYIGGQVGGGLLTTPLLPGAAGGTVGGRALQAAKIGATYGLASGAGRANELADVPGTAAQDAAMGAVAGPAVQLLGEGAIAAVRPLARLAQARFAKTALEQGRKALTGNAGTISVKKPLSPESVQAAYDVGAIRPGSRVGAIDERLDLAREAVGDQYGQVVKALEAAGVTGPNAPILGQSLQAEGRGVAQQSLGSPAPSLYESIGLELQGLRKGMHGISQGAPKTDPATAALGVIDPRLGLVQAENMKRTLQRAARADYIKEGPDSLAGEARKEIASRMRQAVEDAIDAQATRAPAEAAAFVPVKRRLGALIEASDAATIAAAREGRKSNLGLGTLIAASGGASAGGVPGALAAGALAKALQSRGPATIGSIANRLAQASGIKNPTPAQSVALTAKARALFEEMTRARVGFVPAAAEENR